jgi:hypothetical protein
MSYVEKILRTEKMSPRERTLALRGIALEMDAEIARLTAQPAKEAKGAIEELAEPFVHMLPSDLERMRRTETSATAVSVPFTSTAKRTYGERSVALVRLDSVRSAGGKIP